MLRAVLSLLFFFVLAVHSQAQENPEWPPDEIGFSTDLVEVNDISSFTEYHDYYLLNINVDEKARRVYIYDWDVGYWRGFAFPDEVDRIQRPQYLKHGTWLLPTKNILDFQSSIPVPEGYWILDVKLGEIVKPQLICNELPALFEKDSWFLLNERDGYYLCSMETGETIGSIALPDNPMGFRVLDISPDREYAVLISKGYTHDVYSYEFATGTVRTLALGISHESPGYIAEWVDNRRFTFFFNDNREWGYHLVYKADVGMERSARFLMNSMREGVKRFDDPWRYEAVPSVYAENSYDDTCEMIVYYPETDERLEIELGDTCEPNHERFTDWGGNQIFRILNRNGAGQVVDFNAVTRQREIIYEGEVEKIFATSPSGRYIPILLDSSGRVDVSIANYPYPFIPPSDFEPTLSFLDRDTGEFVYRLEWEQCRFEAESVPVSWFRDELTRVNCWQGNSPFTLIINLETQQSISLPGFPGYCNYNSASYLCLSLENSLSVLDIETWETFEVMRKTAGFDYNIDFNGGKLILLIKPYPPTINNPFVSRRPNPPYLRYELTIRD